MTKKRRILPALTASMTLSAMPRTALWPQPVRISLSGFSATLEEVEGRLDDFGEVPSLDMLHARPLDPAPGEEPVLVGLGRALDAVGVEDDGAGEVLELLVLVLPGAAEVARQVLVLLEARVAVGRKHLHVGIDVDPLALGLLEQLLEHLQVMAGDENPLAVAGADADLGGGRELEALGCAPRSAAP